MNDAADLSAGESADCGLLARICQRERDALEALYDRYSPRLFAGISRIVRQVEDAEEVLQDVWVEVWKRAGDYCSRRGTVRAWLHTLARSRALDRYRSLRSRRERERLARERESGVDESAPSGARFERREQIGSLLRELPLIQQQVLAFGYLEGLTQVEIAERLELPLGSIKTWTRRGLETLRETANGFRSEGADGSIVDQFRNETGKTGPQARRRDDESVRGGKRWLG